MRILSKSRTILWALSLIALVFALPGGINAQIIGDTIEFRKAFHAKIWQESIVNYI